MSDENPPEEKPTRMADDSRSNENTVPRHIYEAKVAEYEQLLEAFNTLDEEAQSYKSQLEETQTDANTVVERMQELEGKVRTRAHQDAFDKIADDLHIGKKFRGDVFKLADIKADTDEPDPKAMKKALQTFLEDRQHYIDTTEQQPAGKGKAAPQRLQTEEEGRGETQGGVGKFKYRSSDLADPEWMGKNGKAYAKAQIDGVAVNVGD